ncbi:type IV toxin-antitoxin system AbiEi family antitoxin domain-containing protein [Aeromicrobium panaciterrae]|uniref:type IV toxin-antitoxin system AbiEi family antitoxin domain-containing protein n=1 Tax=Aeromicrobium panaciterrae TaxID=363861 RepID=UPI0031CE2BE3
MDIDLMTRAELRGYITRPEILDCGYDDRDIRAARAIDLLTRIGPGLYALSATYEPLTPEKQHLIRCRAVAHRLGDGVVLTHQSAALMHGMPVWGLDLMEVQLTRRDGKRGRHEAGVSHHIGNIDDTQIVEVDGVLTAKPARTVWEVACAGESESGLVTVDAALHDGLVSHEGLLEVAGSFAHWQGSRSARLALSLADGRSESPGESRARHLFWRAGIPSPDLQFRVVGRDGHIIARTDFAWELYRHLAEFDGRIKYDGTFGDAGFATVFGEKKREDLVRAEMWGLTRLTWADLDATVARATAYRVKADLGRSRSTYGRTIIA